MLLEQDLSALLKTNLRSRLNNSLHFSGQIQLQHETKNIGVLEFGAPYIRDLTVVEYDTRRRARKYTEIYLPQSIFRI